MADLNHGLVLRVLAPNTVRYRTTTLLSGLATAELELKGIYENRP